MAGHSGPICTVCGHKQRREIDTALLDANRKLADISRTYGVTRQSLLRHRANHMPQDVKAVLAQQAENDALARGGTILAQMQALTAEARAVLRQAKEQNDLRLIMAAMDRVGTMLERQAKLEGLIRGDNVTNINITHNDFRTLQVSIVAALAPFPEAKAAVLKALQASE